MPTPTKIPVQMFYSAILAHLQLHAANICNQTPVLFPTGRNYKIQLKTQGFAPISFLGLVAFSRVTRDKIDK